MIPAIAAFMAGGFVPTDIAGLELWLDASDTATITETSGDVSQWDDKSGQGNNVSQGTGANQPQTGTINSNPSINFDGTNDRLVDASASFTAIEPLTMASVFTPTQIVDAGGTDRRVICRLRDGTTNNVTMAQIDGDDLELFHRGNNLNLTISAALAANDSKWAIARTRDGAVNGSNMLDNDAGTASQTAAGALNDVGNEFSIGANEDGTLAFQGHIHEVLVYNRYLTDTERDALEAYLNGKWNV